MTPTQIDLIFRAVPEVVKSIEQMAVTFSNNRATRIKLESEERKLEKEIAEKMNVRDAENERFFREKQAEMQALYMEFKDKKEVRKGTRKDSAEGHKERMKQMDIDRERYNKEHKKSMKELDYYYNIRMRTLDIIEQTMLRADSEIVVFREERRQYGEAYFPLEGVLAKLYSANEQLNSFTQTFLALPPTD